MNIIDRHTLQYEMNRLGIARTPFLWGASYSLDKCFITQTTGPDKQDDDILWQVGPHGNATARPDSALRPSLTIKEAPGQETYATMFSTIMEGLRRGDSFLANLTAATEVCCDSSFEDIFLSSTAPFRLMIGDEFLCFSPEPFVRIKGRHISTFPMKGTADASLPDAEERLLADYKEACEHYTIVDLMRNDLNSIATDVKVDRFRYVERIETSTGCIIQTSSEISGTIPEDMTGRFGDIILPILPAGSITGAPKTATVELIRKAEISDRGWYTGVFGHYDGTVMQTAVMIRCLQRTPDGRLRFHSGGGITVNSNEKDEYAELLSKIYISK